MNGLLINRQSFRPARVGLILGIVAGLLAGTRAEATSCHSAEEGLLVDPMVVVISGPGDAAEEQARLEKLEYALVDGEQQLAMGDDWFNFEVNP